MVLNMINDISKESIINKEITNILCIKAEQNEHTKNWIYSYLVVLKNSEKIIKLDPKKIEIISKNINIESLIDIPVQIIEGGYIGEIIKSIIYRSLNNSHLHDKKIFQYGLLLHSNRIIVNTYKCGGGSIMHIESLSGFIRHNGDEWKDYWTGENVN